MKCIVDEFLFAKYITLDSKGETIFTTFQECFESHNIPLTNITAVACDGAPAMIGRHRGVSTFLREIVPEVITEHCMTHRQHLVSRNLIHELHNYLQVFIGAVNTMKSNLLRSQLFARLFEEDDDTLEILEFFFEIEPSLAKELKLSNVIYLSWLIYMI